jgi:intracellular multiplication protein IcmV
MKKRSKSRIASLFQRIFNIRWWIDFDRAKGAIGYISQSVKGIFVLQKPNKPTSFSEAVASLHIKEEELQARARGLYRLSILMLIIALCLLGYTGYLVLYSTLHSAIVCIGLMGLALIFAFRYHFWYFQIHQRRLGCSIKEWYRIGIWGGKHE